MSTFKDKGYLKIPATGEVYVYCYGGNRATVAMPFIKRTGYTNKFYKEIRNKSSYQRKISFGACLIKRLDY